MRFRRLMVLVLAAAVGAGGGVLWAQMGGSSAVSRVVVVDTADPVAYAAAIAEGQEILAGLGSSSVIRVWQASYAGENTGSIAVSIEWPSMSAMAADDELMTGSEEMAAWLAGLGELRTIVSDSLYREITQ